MTRELLRLIGGMLFVLALNATYSLAQACEGDYHPYVPRPMPVLSCRAC